MLAGIKFAQAIGPERIYARIHQLARRTFERAAQQLPRFRSEDEINFLLLTSLTGAATPEAA